MTLTYKEALRSERTLAFAHRGASAYAPMNTLPAFELALKQGADGIELDVWLTTDGELIICHDASVNATTDGKGYIESMTLVQLKSLDAGRWFDERFKGTQLPTLSEVFDAFGQNLYINVEIKSEFQTGNGIEHAVAQAIQRHNVQDRVIVSSFDPTVLRRFRRIMPDCAIGFLNMPFTDYGYRLMLRNMPYEAQHPYHLMVTPRYVAWARTQGFGVNTWTVNDPERMAELRDLGVNAVMSDKPDVLVGILARSSS